MAITIFDHPARDVILAGGDAFTPNDFVEALAGADFDPQHETDLTIKVAGVAAVFKCWDELDEPHRRMLLKTAVFAVLQGEHMDS